MICSKPHRAIERSSRSDSLYVLPSQRECAWRAEPTTRRIGVLATAAELRMPGHEQCEPVPPSSRRRRDDFTYNTSRHTIPFLSFQQLRSSSRARATALERRKSFAFNNPCLRQRWQSPALPCAAYRMRPFKKNRDDEETFLPAPDRPTVDSPTQLPTQGRLLRERSALSRKHQIEKPHPSMRHLPSQPNTVYNPFQISSDLNVAANKRPAACIWEYPSP